MDVIGNTIIASPGMRVSGNARKIQSNLFTNITDYLGTFLLKYLHRINFIAGSALRIQSQGGNTLVYNNTILGYVGISAVFGSISPDGPIQFINNYILNSSFILGINFLGNGANVTISTNTIQNCFLLNRGFGNPILIFYLLIIGRQPPTWQRSKCAKWLLWNLKTM